MWTQKRHPKNFRLPPMNFLSASLSIQIVIFSADALFHWRNAMVEKKYTLVFPWFLTCQKPIETGSIMLSFGYVVKWGSFMILLSSHILPMAKVRIVKTGGWNWSYCENTHIKSFEASPHLMYLYTWLTQNTSGQPNPDAIQKIDITNSLINEFHKFYSTLWGAGITSHFGKLV